MLVGAKTEIIASALAEYPLDCPKPSWAEQNPDSWWKAVALTSNELMAKHPAVRVKAIGLSGQMHGLVALDSKRAVIRPAILWNDTRNSKECDDVTAAAGGVEGLLALTNNKMVPGYTGGKIIWLRDCEPESFAQMDLMLNPKDYIRLKMTGEAVTDTSDASGTGLFDVSNRRWSATLVELLGLDPSLLPPAFESDTVVGELTSEAASLLGLSAGIDVVAGGGDAIVQTTGSGVVAPGQMQTIIGTAGNLACVLASCMHNKNGRLQVFCNNAKDLWHCQGGALNAGVAMAWMRKLTAQARQLKPQDVSYLQMMEEAGKSEPGAKGLLFLPYLQGERCPHNDPDARGSFVGLHLKHDLGDLIRAVAEGVVFCFADMMRLFADLGIGSDTVVASGGGSSSELWRQIQADVFQAEVVTMSGASEGGAFGAALLAGVGVKHWDSLADACSAISVETRIEPIAENAGRYSDMLGVYCELYEGLRPTFGQLAAL